MDIKQISTTSCETLYDVDGRMVRLFIVTGGEPVQTKPAEVVNPAAGVIETRCAKCHSSDDPKGGLILVDGNGAALKSLPWKKITSRVNSTDPGLRMPPNGMPAEELAQLNSFLKGKVR